MRHMRPTSRDEISAQASEIGAALLKQVAPHADSLCERLLANLPLVRSGLVVTTTDLRTMCEQQLTVIFSAVARQPTLIVHNARERGRQHAAAGVPLSTLLEIAHIVTGYLWEQAAVAATSAGYQTRVLSQVFTEMWHLQDIFVREMGEGYRDEMSVRAGSEETRRDELVRRLLTGGQSSPALWEAADTLGLPYTGPFVVVATPTVRRGEALPQLEKRLRSHDVTAAATVLDGVEAGIVYLPRGEAQMDGLAEVLERAPVVRSGVSPLYTNLLQTAGALRMARVALTGTLRSQPVVLFDRSPLAVTAVSAPEFTRRLSKATLAPLHEMPAKERQLLLDTFGAWLDSGGSTSATAEKLFCHRNTVRYRLRRLEELTGRTLTDPRAVVELSLAFEADRRLSAVDPTGSQALPGDTAAGA